MSGSSRSEEFGFQTRMVVYSFLGLVPTTQSEDEVDGFNLDQPFDGRPEYPSAWNDTLKTLLPVSLIDRLKESESQKMQMQMVCDEVSNKVKRVEPPLVQSQTNDKDGSRDHRHGKHQVEGLNLQQTQQALMSELKHTVVLNELKRTVPTRGRSLQNSTNEEPACAPITIIQKGHRLKILGDAITPCEEADIRRRLSLQPFNSAVQSDTRSSVQLMPHTAPMVGYGYKGSLPKKQTTVGSSSGPLGDTTVTSGKETLSQIDEERDLDLNSSEISEERGGDELQSVDNSGPPVQNSSSRSATLVSPTPLERQSSLWSGSSRRCSTYIDITQPQVNVESLVKSKALPPVTLPLKRELSIAMDKLEKSRQTDEVPRPGESANSPESEVADSLRALGDHIQEEYGPQLNAIVQNLLGATPDAPINYDNLQSVASQLVQQAQQGWTRVALVMLIGQHLAYETLRQGYSGISKIAEYTAQLVEDNTADFIISNGGWSTISDIGIVETESVLSPSDTDCKTVRELFANSNDMVESPIESTGSNPLGTSEGATNPAGFPSNLEMKDNSANASKDEADSAYLEPTTVSALSANLSLQDEGSTMSSNSPYLSLPGDESIKSEIRLIRQNSENYIHEKKSERRKVVFRQSGVAVGLLLTSLIVSWFIFRKFRRGS